MARIETENALKDFFASNDFRSKGPLSLALVITSHARSMGLPLDASKLVTKGGGQVLGAGGDASQAILRKHGVTRILSSEGGRTSRGSMGKMQAYVALLNHLHAKNDADLDVIEKFWVERVNEYFASKPFKIKLDTSKSIRTVVRDVLDQAAARQKTTPGVYYVGSVLQYLVGAKLDCALGKGQIEHNSVSTADEPTGRSGDYFIGDVAIHITTSPSEALIAKCVDNLNDGHRPILVTLQKGLAVAEGLANNRGIADRIDIFEAEQFIALNLYELGKFAAAGRRVAVTDLVTRYNEIINEVDTDPSLKIELRP